MNTVFKVIAALAVAGMLPAVALMAEEPADQEKKLQGSELTKFYLQQILDEAEEDLVVDDAEETEGLVQKLKDLVGRLEKRRQEKLAEEKQKQEAAEAERKVEATAPVRPSVVAGQHPAEARMEKRITLKPELDGPPDAAPMAVPPAAQQETLTAKAPKATPVKQVVVPKRDIVVDPAVAPATAESPPLAPNADIRAQFRELRKRLDEAKHALDEIMQRFEQVGADLAALAKTS
jgi:hypothetical protein